MRALRRVLGAGARGRRRDTGSASLELVGMLPLGLVMGMVLLQVGAVLWAITGTNEAVRQGARAQSLGEPGCGAARASLSRSLTVVSCESGGGGREAFGPPATVDLTVRLPLLPVFDRLTPVDVVHRTAVLP